jgi:hypothetical protein
MKLERSKAEALGYLDKGKANSNCKAKANDNCKLQQQKQRRNAGVSPLRRSQVSGFGRNDDSWSGRRERATTTVNQILPFDKLRGRMTIKKTTLERGG